MKLTWRFILLVVIVMAADMDENCGMDCPRCHTPCIKHFSHVARGTDHGCGNGHFWKK